MPDSSLYDRLGGARRQRRQVQLKLLAYRILRRLARPRLRVMVALSIDEWASTEAYAPDSGASSAPDGSLNDHGRRCWQHRPTRPVASILAVQQTLQRVPGLPPLRHHGYAHQRINHKSHVYVSGDVHTNTIEGFWSLVKRGIGGTYHAVSEKYLQSYLDDYTFRYSHRNDGRAMFAQVVERAASKV
jgi:ISXO2-like transposase domain